MPNDPSQSENSNADAGRLCRETTGVGVFLFGNGLQTAQMRVSACPYPDYGTLKGKVSLISPDAISPQNNSPAAATPASLKTAASSRAFYEVTIEPESLSLGRSDKPCSVQLGMEGRADIISREETVLKFLLRKARLIADL